VIEVKLRVGPFRLHVDLWRDPGDDPDPPGEPPHVVEASGANIGFTAHAEPNELATPATR
jgi:hypothetical protein